MVARTPTTFPMGKKRTRSQSRPAAALPAPEPEADFIPLGALDSDAVRESKPHSQSHSKQKQNGKAKQAAKGVQSKQRKQRPLLAEQQPQSRSRKRQRPENANAKNTKQQQQRRSPSSDVQENAMVEAGDHDQRDDDDDDVAEDIEPTDGADAPTAAQLKHEPETAPEPPTAITNDATPPPPLSVFATRDAKIVRNSDGSYSVTFHPTECITFYGSVDVTVSEGSVTVNHAALVPGSKYELHSPDYDPTALLSITATTSATVTLSQSQSPLALAVSAPDDSVSLLPIKLPGFYALGKQKPYTTSIYAALSSPPSWLSLINSLPTVANTVNFTLLVCGPRNSGKSSLLRKCLNQLLTQWPKVLLIDADIGQGECSPPSVMALTAHTSPILSPPHCHLHLQPLLSFALSDSSFANEPTGYLDCYRSLLTVATSVSKGCPIIVNTGGWIKGLGLTVLNAVIAVTKPSLVAHLTDTNTHGRHSLTVNPKNRIQHLERYQTNGSKLTAEQSRVLSLTAYFVGHTLPITNIASTLAAMKPVRVSFERLSLAMGTECNIDRADVLKLFNCTIVAVCTSTNTDGDRLIEDDRLNNAGVRVLQTFTATQAPCLGLAIVRAIDIKRRCYYLLTPLTVTALATASILYRGSLELPPVLVALPSRQSSTTVTPHCLPGVLTGVGSTRSRRTNLTRKRLIATQQQ